MCVYYENMAIFGHFRSFLWSFRSFISEWYTIGCLSCPHLYIIITHTSAGAPLSCASCVRACVISNSYLPTLFSQWLIKVLPNKKGRGNARLRSLPHTLIKHDKKWIEVLTLAYDWTYWTSFLWMRSLSQFTATSARKSNTQSPTNNLALFHVLIGFSTCLVLYRFT